MQAVIALGGIALMLMGALATLVGIAWIALLFARHLPLVGRRGKHSR
ncbi:MAG TPA: hypothetical protein VL484_15280 [Vicinamibacterales bacterium]|jgi:hypothetical protein|nr:hypothetical protein [Vicinamibacterales bacterium]